MMSYHHYWKTAGFGQALGADLLQEQRGEGDRTRA